MDCLRPFAYHHITHRGIRRRNAASRRHRRTTIARTTRVFSQPSNYWGQDPAWWTPDRWDRWSCGKVVHISGKRRKYTPEFREQAARLVIETGRPVGHV